MIVRQTISRIFVLAFVLLCAASAAAQQNVNEDFELKIIQDRVTEINFERSTSIELNNERRGNLSVRIGVGVTANRIDVILRGIFGRVRFRASLDAIQERLDRLPKKP